MKARPFLMLIFISVFLGLNVGKVDLSGSFQEKEGTSELENFLKTARASPEEWKRVGRRTESYVLSLDDGKTKKLVWFKVTHRPRPHPLPDSYKFEIAAYELARLLSLEIVPLTVERELRGRKGALRLFIQGSMTEEERRRKNIMPPDAVKFENQLELIRIFENLTYHEESFCLEKDLGNILYYPDDKWQACCIDFSTAFEPVPDLIPGCEIKRCSRELYQNLLKLGDQALADRLQPYLNEDEIKAVAHRKKLIVDWIGQLIKERGEESVLFDFLF